MHCFLDTETTGLSPKNFAIEVTLLDANETVHFP